MRNIGICFNHILKISIVIILSLNHSSGQDNAISFLVNKGIVTYIDNTKNTNYTVSFLGDTVRPNEQIPGIYVIDSTLVQIKKYSIPEQMMNFKYNEKNEEELLLHFRDYEFDYMINQVYKKKIACEKEFFNNIYSKLFLIWYFKVPDNMKVKESSHYVNDSTYDKEFVIDYQMFLAFTAGSFVTMINIPVFTHESLLRKIDYVKSSIANSVRVYDGDINIDVLDNQIKYAIKNIPFVINDSSRGIKFNVPYWLNVLKVNRYDLVGTFPDVNNVSNALLLGIFPKSKFDSFKSFEDKMLLEGYKEVNKLNSLNDKTTRYKVIDHAGKGIVFIHQYLFMKLENGYGFLDFTATPSTYDKNEGKFNEFVNGIEVK